MAKDLGIPIKELDKKHLDKISKTYNHQGIIAETAEYKYSEIEDLLEKADKKRRCFISYP